MRDDVLAWVVEQRLDSRRFVVVVVAVGRDVVVVWAPMFDPGCRLASRVKEIEGFGQ